MRTASRLWLGIGAVMSAIATFTGTAAASDALPDPTRPAAGAAVIAPATATVAAPRPRLNSLLIAEQRRIAVIDGELLTEGQTGRRVRVLRIDAQGTDVVVLATGEPLRLSFEGHQRVRRSEPVR
jgi:hypothetical protein